jgi:hypothetical protein
MSFRRSVNPAWKTVKDSARHSQQIMGDTQHTNFPTDYQPLSEAHMELIDGGGRRRRMQSSQPLAPSGGFSTAINNMFVQINIAMYFVFGGDNVTIFGLQQNAADNEVFFRAG